MPWTPLPDALTPAATPVLTKDDFPAPVAGVITLPAGTAWQIQGTIDLAGDRIVCGGIISLSGTSSETAFLTSTGLVANPLLTSTYTLPMRNLTFKDVTAVDAVALDAVANPNSALDWNAVNFDNVPSIGTIKDYSNVIYTAGAWLESAGLLLDGTIGTASFQTSLLNPPAASTAIRILNTASITRRFRVTFSAFVVGLGETGIKVDNTASLVTEGFILDTVSFSGAGTFLDGIDELSTKALITGCTGIANSAEVGDYNMQGNLSATTILAANTFVKVAGTTTNGAFVSQFTQTNNRATYDGNTKLFSVSAIVSITSGNNKVVEVRIAKNGTTILDSSMKMTTNAAARAENGTSQVVVSLDATDYIEVWVANTTDTDNVTVTELSVLIQHLL